MPVVTVVKPLDAMDNLFGADVVLRAAAWRRYRPGRKRLHRRPKHPRPRELLQTWKVNERTNVTAALRRYKTKHALIKDPFSVSTVTRLIAKFESTGSVLDFPGKGRKSLSDERTPIVQNAVEQLQSQNTMASSPITQVSQLTGIPRASVHRIMRCHLYLCPYHSTLLQNITEEDKEQRVTFANWLLGNEEIVPNILWSDETNFSVDGIINKHHCVIWSREAPHEYLIHDLHSPHLWRKSLSDERTPIVQNAVEQLQSQNTMASSPITQVSQLTGIPRASVHRIMRCHLYLCPYHSTLLQNITEEDKEQRVTFANWLLGNEEIVPNILWSDETNFSVDGIINKHHCVIWSREAPHEYLIHDLHSPHLCVWMGFSSRCLLRPFFFDATVSGDSYLHMLQTHVIPQLKQHKKSPTVFQQDGAPPHYSNQVRTYLREQFSDERFIAGGFQNFWPEARLISSAYPVAVPGFEPPTSDRLIERRSSNCPGCDDRLTRQSGLSSQRAHGQWTTTKRFAKNRQRKRQLFRCSHNPCVAYHQLILSRRTRRTFPIPTNVSVGFTTSFSRLKAARNYNAVV
ncbi:hypothetical protein CLF_102678 [Clonorchis sinensis]|uniref:DUF4817 domain-containing protein n=1 Tax=Clonorchis sinensis TaxID=79923 RepID=G7YN51_CLOSI|nr:hypothetical protein CLF_102678 [Clonorchis sinensis]